MNQAYRAAKTYHEETKHHFHRYARSLGYMDWKNQPNPYRFYEDAPLVKLPLDTPDPQSSFDSLCAISKEEAPFTFENMAKFLELSLGISAWKEYGQSKWALRMNPSSGNLHPTESYWILPATDKSSAGLYHYNPFLHALEQRKELPDDAQSIPSFPDGGVLLALSSIYWREAWKYGERAFRYCNHDVGHALGALSFAANLFGWKVTIVDNARRSDAQALFGFDKTEWPMHEEEEIDIVCSLTPQSAVPNSTIPKEFVSLFSASPLKGTPNRLSAAQESWDIINETARDLQDEFYFSPREPQILHSIPPSVETTYSATEIIRKRRSAQAFHPGNRSMPLATFTSIIGQTLPHQSPPFSVGLHNNIDLLLFIHGVEGIPKGLYLLSRSAERLPKLKSTMKAGYLWEQPVESLPLYLLEEGDEIHLASRLSCQQDIAGDSSFSLGMLAEFDTTLQESSSAYKALFWEAGMIGQILYLQAEAYDYRGTGIGCFFDDPVHKFVGIEDASFQSLYHFTVGFPVTDSRIQTLAPYHHLQEDK